MEAKCWLLGGLTLYTCVESIARAVFMHSNPVLERLGLEEMGPRQGESKQVILDQHWLEWFKFC